MSREKVTRRQKDISRLIRENRQILKEKIKTAEKKKRFLHKGKHDERV